MHSSEQRPGIALVINTQFYRYLSFNAAAAGAHARAFRRGVAELSGVGQRDGLTVQQRNCEQCNGKNA